MGRDKKRKADVNMPGERSRWAESKKRLFCIGYPDLPRVIRRHLTSKTV